jgi:lipoprotein-releasing system ATP-binding protein
MSAASASSASGGGGEILRAAGIERVLGTGEGAARILQGIDLSVDRGQFVALTGASGSGKSTLLYLLGVLDRPTTGEVYLAGAPTSRLDDDARAELRNRKLGFVFQFHFLLPEFSAEENAMIPLMRQGRPEAECRARAREVLAELGLAEKARRRPSQLSGGEQQRVSIARALANRPEVLLADEPTGNLDSRNAENVFQIFERLSQSGLTVVMVTHDVSLAQRATRRVELKDGRVIGDHQRAIAA